ncbi:MAG: GtrA family protein, partial [Clostridiaceae bacterium]|nr:GtrA family protein [Clostridiaceae bacterium]
MKKARYYLTELFFSIEFLKYFVTGVIATIVNVLVYMFMNRWLGLDKWYYSDVPAIVLSVLSAYILNRVWVFRSTSSLWQEFIRFVGSRLAISFVFEYGGIYLMNHVLNWQIVLIPGMLDLAKLMALAFVVLANRISGK